MKGEDIVEINPTLDYGYEHRIGAKLYDYEYNDTIDKEDMVGDIRKCIDSLYTTSLDKQRAACNIKRVGGLMSDFVNDLRTNSFYGFSNRSFVLKFPIKNVFYFNSIFINRLNRHSLGYKRPNMNPVNNVNSAKHKAFTNISEAYPTPMGTPTGTGPKVPVSHWRDGTPPPTTDVYNIKFNITDTANRPDIFSHRLLFFLDGMLFTDLMMYIVPNYILMVIDCERNTITRDVMERFTDPSNDFRWTMIGLPFGNYYKTPSDGYNLHPVSDSDFRIKVGEFDQRRTYKLTPDDKEINENIEYSRYTMSPGISAEIQYREPSKAAYLSAAAYDNAVKGLKCLSINTIDSTGTKRTEELSDGSIRETVHKDYHISCFDMAPIDANSQIYKFIGLIPTTYLVGENSNHVQFTELGNFGSVIDLGVNRIFQVGCSDKMPGPVPPENILIFKYEADIGLRLVHMVTSEYKNSDGTTSKFNDKVIASEHPNEKMIPFKAPDGLNSVYDFPKFIPTRDIYSVSSGGESVKYINLYFPNVYTLTGFNPSDHLIALVFYDSACDNSFDNPLKSYMEYDTNYANNIVSGNIPKEIKAYIPRISQYTEDVYLNSYHTKATRATEYHFKLSALRELVNDDYRRLIDIYDRRYKKTQNKMHSNVKYIIDLSRTSEEAAGEEYKIRHFYRDQLTEVHRYMKCPKVTTINVVSSNGDVTPYEVDGAVLYYAVEPTGNFAFDTSTTDINGDVILPNRTGFVIAHVGYNASNDPIAINISESALQVTPISSYKLFLNHKDASKFPVTVWIDGSRMPTNYYDISQSAFSSAILINKEITTNAHYIEIEIYKMVDTDAKSVELQLTDMHDSTQITQGIWNELSPQNTLVAIKENTMDKYDPSQTSIRYRVPSSYESYWLLIGNTQYNRGVPINIDINERQNAYIYEYNVIKSLQAEYTDGSGELKEKSEVVILADDTTALIGETDQMFMGNIDILKTFGDRKYYKMKSTDETIYMQLVNNNERYKEICEIKRNHGLTDYEQARYLALNHKILDGETLTASEQEEYDDYEDKLADYAENGLSNEDKEFYREYTQQIEDMGFDTHFTEYITMLREGFYNRDRKRFYDYLPTGTRDPEVFITPITPFFANKTVKVLNTDVYFSKTLRFNYVSGTIVDKSVVIENFGFDPSPYKFRVYLDNRLLDYDHDYITDVHLENQNFYLDSDMRIFFRCPLDVHAEHTIVFEYLPYKYQLIHRSNEYDGIITLGDEYIRPYDPRNFDVYVNGILVPEDNITAITERRISLNDIVAAVTRNKESGTEFISPVVSIYERMHDEDVYDYVWRNHKTAFSYIDHDEPTIWDGEKYVDNVKRQPEDPNEFIDVKMPQRLAFSLDEQLMRNNKDYRKSRTPTYDPEGSNMEINNWIFGG
jgi:hypothetical protein